MRQLVVLTSLLAVCLAGNIKLPKSWKICKRSDPNYSECIRDAAQSAIRGLKGGNKKLGIMPLDPLHFDRLEIHQADGPVAINIVFEDVDVTGIANVVIDKFEVNWDTFHIESELHLEEPAHSLSVVGKYEAKGNVLALPINGKGACNLTLDHIKATVILDAKPLEKDGARYLDFTDIKLHVNTSKMHILLENLFNGDKALGDQMNVFLNENWSEILNELMPAISQAISKAFTGTTNAIFHKMPLDEISPP